ncbi:MAG: PAS domain S-box protein [Syntrophus sp. (in: bacteria)]
MHDQSSTYQELIKENSVLKQKIRESKHIEQRIQESEQFFHSIVENSYAGIYASDNHFRFTYVNDKLCEICGYTREELLGMDLRNLVAEESLQLVADRYIRRRNGENVPSLYEFIGVHKNGEKRSFETNATTVKNADGQVRTIGQILDITERKRAEDALRKSEEYFRAITENATDVLFIVDALGMITYCSHSVERITGYRPDDLIGTSTFDLIIPDDQPKASEDFSRALLTKEVYLPNSFRIRHKNGTMLIMEGIGKNLLHDPVIGGFVMNVRDVTDRKRVEEELGKSRRLLSDLIEYSGALICVKDREGRYELINCKWEEVTGLKRLDTIGRTDEELFPGHVGKQFRLNDLEVMESGSILEKEETIEDEHGTRFFISIKFPLRDDDVVCGICGMFTEITERKRAEQVLRETENLYRIFINATSDMVFLKDELLRNVVVNKSMASFFGKPEEEIIGKSDFELMPQFAAEKCRQTDMESLSKNSIFTSEEIIGDHVYETLKFPIELGNNRIGVGGFIRDITTRKRAEDALRESEAKYRLIAENSTDVIWTMSLDGHFTYVSPSVTMHAGFTHEEAMAMTIETYMYEEDMPWAMEIMYDEMQKPRGERTERRILEIRQYKKDGSLLDVEVSVAWLYDERGEIIGIQGSTRDISARKQAEETRRKLEERLVQAQKMESIGTLAGGIAHDFNNLLMGIQGYASLMLMDLDAGNPHYEKLKAIEKQVASGADLTRQLLGFARGGRYEVKPADINILLAKAAAIFGRTKKEIRMHEKYGENILTVDVDHGQMDQVLLNLFVNAWQAMPGGGDLFLETDNVHLDAAYVASYEIRPGPYVKISVTDTGVGMNEKTRQRIFDPFFTTRKMGRGTGLGLATVYGIVKGHGGMVIVDSEPGHGTTFTIYLPASDKEVEKEKMATGTIVRGSETILIADDEKMVLEVSKAMLESMGYRVYAAGSGQEAIDVYKEKRNEIDLVILDMIMPGISGSESFNRLREINPGIKVLLSSGYSIEGQAKEIMDRGCNGFLQKPFKMDNLSQKVREMLD